MEKDVNKLFIFDKDIATKYVDLLNSNQDFSDIMDYFLKHYQFIRKVK